MRWQLFATLAESAGDNEVEVPVEEPEPTLRDALDSLLATHPGLEPQVLADDGSLQEHIRLLCDGEDPFHAADGWETELSEVEELALFPPVTGG
jgi:molybdopterin synthase sulfur carrier subunit